MQRKSLAAILAVTGVVVLAACGDSDKTSSTSTPSAGATAATKLSGPPIVIGTICSCSGPQKGSLANTGKVLEAWAAYKNDNGGINGHPVKVIVLDDGGDAAKSTQALKRLIETEKVQAIVGEQSIVDVAWTKTIAASGVPVIGASSYNTTFLTAPGFYTTGAQQPSLLYGLLEEAKRAGKSKVAVLPCAEAPACALVPQLVAGFGKLLGVEMVYSAKISVTQPSYTANCLAARSKGADAMMVIDNAATVMRVADQCAQQGYKPQQLNLSATAGPSWADNANMAGTITTQPQPVLADKSIAATKQFHAVLDKYAPDVAKSSEYNESNLWVYSAGEAFALAGERAKLTPASTAKDVVRGLRTFKAETVGGLTPPLTFTEEGPSPLIPCYFTTTIKDGAFTAPQGAKPTCLTGAKAQALGAALQS